MNKPKHILVSFSGGIDSTYLVYKNLKKGYRVTGLYTTIQNNDNKVMVEKFQVEKLTRLFNKEFDNQFDLRMGMSVYAQCGSNLIFKQITIWLVSLLYEGDKYDEIHIGAVMNDDMISYVDDIKKMWKAMLFLKDQEEIAPLLFPITKMTKWQIVEALPQQYKELVTYCENPTIVKSAEDNNGDLQFANCKECNACKRYAYNKDMFNVEYGLIQQDKKSNCEDGDGDMEPDISQTLHIDYSKIK